MEAYVIVTRAESPRVFVVKGYEKDVAIKTLGFEAIDVLVKPLASFEIDCLDVSKSVIFEL